MHATRPDVPRGLSVALERALSKDPEQRFPAMEEFAAALTAERRSGSRTVVSAPIKPLAKGGPPAHRPKRSRTSVRRSLIPLGICAMVGGAAWAGLREPTEPPE